MLTVRYVEGGFIIDGVGSGKVALALKIKSLRSQGLTVDKVLKEVRSRNGNNR